MYFGQKNDDLNIFQVENCLSLSWIVTDQVIDQIRTVDIKVQC